MNAKLLVANTLTHPLVGKGLATLFRNRIPGAGGRFDTSAPAIDDRSKASLFWGFYESGERRFIESMLRSDLDVIDLGASMGVVVSAIARKLEPGRRIVTVEANPRLIPALRANIERNAPGRPITIVHGAVSYESSAPEVDMEIGDRSIAGRLASGASATVVSVPRLTLSGLLEEHGYDGDFTLVSDIEGAEIGMLLEEGSALGRCRQIVAELHPGSHGGRSYTLDEVVGLASALPGFTLRARHGGVVVLDRA